MAEKGRKATDDVVAIRPEGEMVDPRKIIPGERIAPPAEESRDPMPAILDEMDRQAGEKPTVPSANARVKETPTVPPVKKVEERPLEGYTSLHGVAIRRSEK